MTQERQYIPALITALAVALVPHAVRLPWWIIAWCAGLWVYLLVSLRRGWARPGRTVRSVLAFAGLGGLLLTHGGRLGPETYIGLLAVMAALKPFESRTHRDRMVTVFIAYFIIISSLLQVESFAVTLYMFVSVLVTTAALVHINNPSGRYGRDLRRAGRIMAEALPLMIVLFLLFPRLQGSFFGLWPSGTARTGFSDKLSPGSISRLVENNEVAFRVTFAGEMPPARQLYWRGIVFQKFADGTWQRITGTPPMSEPLRCEDSVDYTISLEPHQRRWVFALDVPARSPSRWITLERDYTLQARRPLRRSRRYEMQSCPGYHSERIIWGVEAARRLPRGGNPRTRQLAQELAKETGTVPAFVNRALDYLRTNNFAYTVNPPLLGDNPVDDFLFSSRRGYCEHYASAFGYLIRAAGVPARLVGGYLGGEVNPYADYLMVRQSDAHVWVEVWYPGQGWTRVDPTLAVVPERLAGGAEETLSAGDTGRGLIGRYLGRWEAFFKRAGLGWDALSTRWEAWIARYSDDEQRALLEKMGIPRPSWKSVLTVMLLALAVVSLIMGLYGLWRLRPRRVPRDPVGIAYQTFCRRLARAGLPRPPGMGPRDYAALVARRRPDLAEAVETITEDYIRLRYRQKPEETLRKAFFRKVRTFRPGADGGAGGTA